MEDPFKSDLSGHGWRSAFSALWTRSIKRSVSPLPLAPFWQCQDLESAYWRIASLIYWNHRTKQGWWWWQACWNWIQKFFFCPTIDFFLLENSGPPIRQATHLNCLISSTCFHWVPTLLRLAVLQPVMPIINIFYMTTDYFPLSLFWGVMCARP